MKTQIWMQMLCQITTVALSSSCALLAQVVPDQTLPAGERSQVSGDRNIQIDGGAIRESNLFHSFQQFSIPTNGSASFNNPSNIANIITRVSGNTRSDIDGLIRANGTANLFLINPNGILFGANARLELGGSFLASTAEGLKFANGFEFSATSPQPPPLLTISAPIGLQYGGNPREVRSQGAILQVPNGQTLALAGGDVNIDGGQLLALGGRVELAGVAAPSEVGLTLPLTLPEKSARADVAIGNDAIVSVRAGGGGNIAINARNLRITGYATRLRAGIDPGLGSDSAQASDIHINTTEVVSMNSGLIGNVVEQGTGNAGNINITTGSLSLINGGNILTSTRGKGDAGNITITARDAVSMDGVDSTGFSSGAFSNVAANAIGQGGDINITTGSLSLTNGAELVASTFGRGDAGKITITARDTVAFDGMGGQEFPNGIGGTGFSSSAFTSVEPEAIGQGGDINIITGSLSLTNGGGVVASTRGQGNAGNITITARNSVTFDGVGNNGLPNGLPSAVQSTVEFGADGRGGEIKVNTRQFSIINGAALTASSEGQRGAGNVDVNVRQLRLDKQGLILTQAALGRGGDITLQVSNLLLLRRNSSISTTAGTAQAGGDGGNITIKGNFIVAVPRENSNITANAFSGRGGNVSLIAQGIFGIEPRSRETPLSDITASSEFGISGTIVLNTPDVDRSRGTATLPSGVIDVDTLIASSCVARRSRQGQFVITGAGGLAPQPDDLANATFPTYELVPEKLSQPSITEADRIYHLPAGDVILGRSCD